jgi:hypothetical protein
MDMMAIEADIESSTTATRCKHCAKLTIDLLRDNEVKHHASLSDLRDSAEVCDLCRLFWHRLETNCHPDALNSHLQGKVFASNPTRTDTSILVRGEIYDTDTSEARLRPEFSTRRSKILIWSGYDHGSAVDGTQVYTNLSVFAISGKKLL